MLGVKTSHYCKPDQTLLCEALILKVIQPQHEKSIATPDKF